MTSKPQAKQLLLSEIFPPIHGGSGRWFYEGYRRMDLGSFIMLVNEAVAETRLLDRQYPQKVIREYPQVRARIIWNWNSLRSYKRIAQHLCKIIRQDHIRASHAGRTLHEGWVAQWMKIRCGIS